MTYDPADSPPAAPEREPPRGELNSEHEYLRGVMARIAKAVGYDSAFVLEMVCKEGESPAEKVAAAVERLAAERGPVAPIKEGEV